MIDFVQVPRHRHPPSLNYQNCFMYSVFERTRSAVQQSTICVNLHDAPLTEFQNNISSYLELFLWKTGEIGFNSVLKNFSTHLYAEVSEAISFW